MEIIAHIFNNYKEKFGIPRQSGLVDNTSRIVFAPAYRTPDALRGIGEFSHLWLIWEFSDSKGMEWSPTVRPPRLGGNERVGVFATRSPHRPNPIGLSSVRLIGIEETSDGTCLVVSGADLKDGTPIYDIKPYLSYTDSHPDAVCGFTDGKSFPVLEVVDPDNALIVMGNEAAAEVKEILSIDPRPAYHDDPDRIYGITFGDYNIRFKVYTGVLSIVSVENND